METYALWTGMILHVVDLIQQKKRPKANPWNPPAPRARGATVEWNLQQNVANKSEKKPQEQKS